MQSSWNIDVNAFHCNSRLNNFWIAVPSLRNRDVMNHFILKKLLFMVATTRHKTCLEWTPLLRNIECDMNWRVTSKCISNIYVQTNNRKYIITQKCFWKHILTFKYNDIGLVTRKNPYILFQDIESHSINS